MSIYYKISLTPLAPYFFGKDAISELGNKQNYFQTSAFLPPQTTLLGMLRHHLLLKKGWAFPQVEQSTKEELENLIGEKGFDPSGSNNYGVIEKLSPVFITHNNQGHYFLCNKLFVKGNEVVATKSKGKSFGSIEDAKSNLVLKLNKDNLTSKDIFDEYFMDYKEVNTRIKFNKVVTQVLQTGNTKTAYRSEMNDDEAYYRFNYSSFINHTDIKNHPEEKRIYRKKQINSDTFMLNDTFKFAFYVQLKSDELEDKFNNVIIMGKEQSPFIMEIEKIPLKNGKQSIPVIFESLPVNSDHKRVWILSNLYTDDSSRLKTNTNFICAESIPFKCFTKAINHSQRSKTWSFSKPNKTVEYSLYKQGGIIYTDKISELTATVFDAAGEWKKIGYNYFKTI